MMNQYCLRGRGLSMEEIDIREERCVQVEVPIGGKRRRPIDGRSDGHGPKFVGIYAQLLMRYLRAPADALITSLHAAGIDMDMQAKPIFIDEWPTARTPADPATSSVS